MKIKYILFSIVVIGLLSITSDSIAQYGGYGGGGYGGGYGGGGYGGYGGGYGRQRMPGADFPQSKKKDPNALDPEELATKETKWMKKKLDLDGDQELKADSINIYFAFKVYDMFEDFKKIIGTLKPDQKPSQELMDKVKAKREEIKNQLTVYQDQKDKAVKTILNDTQWATYEKKKRTIMEDVAGN